METKDYMPPATDPFHASILLGEVAIWVGSASLMEQKYEGNATPYLKACIKVYREHADEIGRRVAQISGWEVWDIRSRKQHITFSREMAVL